MRRLDQKPRRCLRALTGAALATLALTADMAEAQGFRRFAGRGLAGACASDYFRLCPGVAPGGGRILVCLNAQAEKLSQSCFQALAERGLAFAGVVKLCKPDFERLCPNVTPGLGRGLECLMDNAERVSSPCRDALATQGFDADADAPIDAPLGGGPDEPATEQLPWLPRREPK